MLFLKCCNWSIESAIRLSLASSKLKDQIFRITIITLLGLAAATFMVSGYTLYALYLSILLITFSLLLALFNKVTLASLNLVYSMLLIIFLLAIVGDGIRDEVLIALPAVIFLSVVLLGRNHFYIVNILGVICLAVLEKYRPLLFSTIDITSQYDSVFFIILIMSLVGGYVAIFRNELLKMIAPKDRKLFAEPSINIALSQASSNTDPSNILTPIELVDSIQALVANSTQSNYALMTVQLRCLMTEYDAVEDDAYHYFSTSLQQAIPKQFRTRLTLLRATQHEFVIVGHGELDTAVIFNLADKLKALSSSYLQQDTDFFVYPMVIGIAIGVNDKDSSHVLYEQSRQAMKMAIDEKISPWFVYSALSAKHFTKNAYCIYQALIQDKIQVYYQPKISLSSNNVIGYEALIRWAGDDQTYFSPSTIIAEAERFDFINELGDFVIKSVLSHITAFKHLCSAEMVVAINVSAKQLAEGDFDKKLLTLLKQFSVPARCIEIELTETVLVEDLPHIRQQLASLNCAGVNILIDDFGTGYSNLKYLTLFSASTIKIDRSFVAAITSSKQDALLLKAMVQLAKTLNFNVVAEGIEDENTLAIVRKLGCDSAQGFFWSKAIPFAQLVDFWQSANQCESEGFSHCINNIVK